MHGWFLIQTFYNWLKRTSREHLDAAAAGAFFLLQVREDCSKSRLGLKSSPTPYPWCTPCRWNRHDRH
jgi:hypothetical protein